LLSLAAFLEIKANAAKNGLGERKNHTKGERLLKRYPAEDGFRPAPEVSTGEGRRIWIGGVT